MVSGDMLAPIATEQHGLARADTDREERFECAPEPIEGIASS
jgi:hypothetical protein